MVRKRRPGGMDVELFSPLPNSGHSVSLSPTCTSSPVTSRREPIDGLLRVRSVVKIGKPAQQDVGLLLHQAGSLVTQVVDVAVTAESRRPRALLKILDVLNPVIRPASRRRPVRVFNEGRSSGVKACW